MTQPHSKIRVTSKSPVGDISVVTLIRTDTTLDHSQKAEKVCLNIDREEHCNLRAVRQDVMRIRMFDRKIEREM